MLRGLFFNFIYGLVGTIVLLIKYLSWNNKPITKAKVVNYEEKKFSSNQIRYVYNVEFQYNGREYKLKLYNPFGNNTNPYEVGSTVDIYFNEKNKRISEADILAQLKKNALETVVGIAVIIAAIIILIVLAKISGKN